MIIWQLGWASWVLIFQYINISAWIYFYGIRETIKHTNTIGKNDHSQSEQNQLIKDVNKENKNTHIIVNEIN